MATTPMDQLRAESRKLSAADFAGTVRSHFPFWDAQYRPYLLAAVKALPTEGFDFKPRPEMLTAQQMILHIAEAERAWITNVVEGGPYVEWVAQHADPAQGWVAVHDAPDHKALLHELETCHRYTQRWLDKPVAELSRVIKYKPKDLAERQYTLHWILDHVQEHEIHHRAQLNIYLRLMGVEPPSI